MDQVFREKRSFHIQCTCTCTLGKSSSTLQFQRAAECTCTCTLKQGLCRGFAAHKLLFMYIHICGRGSYVTRQTKPELSSWSVTQSHGLQVSAVVLYQLHMYTCTVYTYPVAQLGGSTMGSARQWMKHASLGQTCVACVVQCRVPTDLMPPALPSLPSLSPSFLSSLHLVCLSLFVLPNPLPVSLSPHPTSSLPLSPTHFLPPSLPNPLPLSLSPQPTSSLPLCRYRFSGMWMCSVAVSESSKVTHALANPVSSVPCR